MFRIKAPGHKFSFFNFVPSQKMDAYWPCTWILSIKFHHYFTACIAYWEAFIDFYYKIQSLITILFVCLRYCREGFTVWKIWDDMKHSAGLTQDLFLFCLLMLSVQSVRRRDTLTWLESKRSLKFSFQCICSICNFNSFDLIHWYIYRRTGFRYKRLGENAYKQSQMEETSH